MSMPNRDSVTELDSTVQTSKKAALSTFADVKEHATQAADLTKNTLSTMASDARGKISDIIDHQKAAGADQLSGLARAAQSAAGDLDDKNPQVARFVRDAASSVDRFAGDLRNRDVRDVLSSVNDFARQQPIAFFAGSVLVGLVLARFLKSDTPPSMATGYRSPTDRYPAS